MAKETIQLNDVGTVFVFPITDGGATLDLSSATVKQVKFRKPKTATLAAETVTKTATFVTDGTDGLLKYTTVETDIDRKGTWSVQAYIEIPTWKGHSDIKIFIVGDNL